MGRYEIIIRDERVDDIDDISDVTKAAFENHPISRHTEQFIIKALRAADALSISLVAEVEGKVAGHIAFSPVKISDGSEGWYGLGPISVLPEYQRQGIGTALMNEGIRRLEGMGAKGCALVGEPGYYERFGFGNFAQLRHEGVPQEVFLALALGDDVAEGVVEFHDGFWAKS